jgi:hypothetical protein
LSTTSTTTEKAITPPVVAARYGVNVHRVLGWIARGELAAVNVGDGSRPRWRIMPESLADFERRRASVPKLKATRRKREKQPADFVQYF